jgi:D-beta-D-heptose 7-phosphate kinase/D-beta-D-heptose 1-phosphate adenosyltransferase
MRTNVHILFSRPSPGLRYECASEDIPSRVLVTINRQTTGTNAPTATRRDSLHCTDTYSLWGFILKTMDTLVEIVDRWKSSKVIVIGDAAIDRWIYGTVHRTSPEAPVPVVLQERIEETLGMAGLVANMVNELCGHAVLITSDRPRPVKTRLMARVPGRGYQPIARIDQESTDPIPCLESERLLDRVVLAIQDGYRSILLCDYSKGCVTPHLCRGLRELSRQYGIPVAVDPGRGSDWSNYRGMLIKANQSEWGESGFMSYPACVSSLRLRGLIVTHGSKGMNLCLGRDDEHAIVGSPVDGADVCGAGDQSFAVLGLALACGANLVSSCRLADAAGRLQAMRHGCVPVTHDELISEIGSIT